MTFQNPTELVLNCGPGAGCDFDFAPPEGYRGVGEWIAAESQESAMRTTAYSYWTSARGGDAAAAGGAASPGPPSPLRRTMSALTPALSERETLPLRCTSGHMQTLLDQQDRIVSASARYVSVVGALEGGELLWAAAAGEARGAEARLDGASLLAACRADAGAWYFEATVTRRTAASKRKGKSTPPAGAVVTQSAADVAAWSAAIGRAEFAVGWATPRFFGDYKEDGAAGGVGGDGESWAIVECGGRLWACHGAEGEASTRVPCVSLSYEGGPITLEAGSTVSCAARAVTKAVKGGGAAATRIEMRWAINGTWLDFSAGASGAQRGAHFVHRVEPLAREALEHGGLRPAVSAAGGNSLQLNFGERAFDYAEMLALPAETFSVHTTELKRLGRDSDVADLGSAAGTELAAQRDTEVRSSFLLFAIFFVLIHSFVCSSILLPAQRDTERDGDAAAARRLHVDADAAVGGTGVGAAAAAAPARVFAIGQLQDAARRLRAASALGSDSHAAALLDTLDATIARLERIAS